jgi:hypothetical protein
MIQRDAVGQRHLRRGARASNGLKTERNCGGASSPRREEGEWSTYLTDEQRRDATQIRDFATDSNRSVL